MIRIGTSGWAYPHWRGVFYPSSLRGKDWFSFYAEHFDTVEVNNTFYRLPEAAVFQAWRRQAPAGFLYAVKASRYITHVKKLIDPRAPLGLFLERAAHLQEKLGPILYQLPPNWTPDLKRFRAFLGILPAGRAHVIEFRDARWLTEEVFGAMAERRVAHCIHDRAGLNVPPRVTAPPAYVRLHGDPAPGGDYPDAMLSEWAERIRGWSAQSLDVFVYFNNDAGGFAVKNARRVKEILGPTPVRS
jgi:uncharacterized protein YecE (DUF72 family)